MLLAFQVIILLVLLVSWMEDPPGIKEDIQVIEFFSGVGRISGLSHHAGYTAVGFDMEYGIPQSKRTGRRNSMDLNSSAGLALAIKLILRSRLDDMLFEFCTSQPCYWKPRYTGT